MDIDAGTLVAEWDNAVRTWPFIPSVEVQFGLPQFMLGAVGSRESNLRNIMGDWGQRPGESYPRFHGYGVWQRDSQHPGVGPAYLNDVHAQAVDAANLLAANYRACRDWRGAAAMYNSGQTDDRYTTPGPGSSVGDYGVDVMGRLATLWAARGGHPWMSADVPAIQAAVHAVVDGSWGPDTERRVSVVRACALHLPYNVGELQAIVGARVDGQLGPETFMRWLSTVKLIQAGLRVSADGVWGNVTDAAYKTASPYA